MEPVPVDELRYSWPGVSVAIVNSLASETRMAFTTHEVGFALESAWQHESWVDRGPAKPFPIQRGMGWIVPSGCLAYGCWRSPLRYLEVSIDPWCLDDLLPAGLDRSQIHFHARQEFIDPLLVEIGLALHTAAAGVTDTEIMYRDSLLTVFSAHLIAKSSNIIGIERTSSRRPELRRVLSYIEDNIGKSLNLDDLASVACLSRFHFARVFKGETGRAPHAYILERRIARAIQLLRETDLTSSEITDRCGFASLSHLSERLRRMTGKTPREFRNTL